MKKVFGMVLGLISITNAVANKINFGLNAPSIDAQSYILMDYNSGAILASFNEDAPTPPASLNKLMVAYVVEEAIKQGLINNEDIATISRKAWAKNFPGSSLMFLEPGMRVSIKDLKLGLIVVSGNDAAVALSEYVSGSQDAFVKEMNRYAKELQLNNTHFSNVHGLDADDQYSTALDLVNLSKNIISNHPEDYELYSEREFQYNIKSVQKNRNGLLWDETLNVDGLKTGHTDGAGYHLVASAYNDNTRLIGVILGSSGTKQREQDMKRLLQWGFASFETIKPIVKGKTITEQTVYFGMENKVKLGVLSEKFITLPKASSANLKARFELKDKYLEAPLKQGQVVGKVVYYLNDKEIAHDDLQVLNDVAQAGVFGKFVDFVKVSFKKLID